MLFRLKGACAPHATQGSVLRTPNSLPPSDYPSAEQRALRVAATMPPKGSGAKAKAKAKAKANAAPAQAQQPQGGGLTINVELKAGETDSSNSTFLEDVIKAKDLVLAHPLFHGIVALDPLPISSDSESGSVPPFEPEDYKKAIKARGEYTAGVNGFWQDYLWTPTPGVPVRRKALATLTETTFKTPASLTLHFAVESEDFNPLNHKGALQRVSPEGLCRAVDGNCPGHPEQRVR